jgi:hypothetical protein
MRRTAAVLTLTLALGVTPLSVFCLSQAPTQTQTIDLDKLRARAEQGDVEAQLILAARYANGVGVERDMPKAAEWYRKAAEQGNAVAQVNLGALYAAGRGVPPDDAQAAAWYRMAAEQGNVLGQFNLGVFYALGRGVPQDHAQAVALYRKAAEQGLPEAKSELARMEQAGIIGSPKSPAPTERNAASSMTNSDVIALCKAGLSDEVVLNAIRSATQSAFDVSTAGLLELAKAGVPSRVIVEMQKPRTAPAASVHLAPPAPSDAPAPSSAMKPCLIVKIYQKKGADAWTRWTVPAPFNYVEGALPVGVKFRSELRDEHVREIQEKGGHVVVMKADYALADLEDARKSCRLWQNGKQ